MDKAEKTVLSGNWNINIDVPEKFYNRSEEYYKVVSSTNDRFNIYSAKLTDTGFEFGMTIKDEHKPTYPEAVRNERKNIIEKYGVLNEDGLYTSESQKIMSQKMNELSVISLYKEMLEKYEKEDTPIFSCGLTIDVKSDFDKDNTYTIREVEYKDEVYYICTDFSRARLEDFRTDENKITNPIGYYLKVRDIQNLIEISIEDKIGNQRPIIFYKY